MNSCHYGPPALCTLTPTDEDEFCGEIVKRPHREDVYWWIAEVIFFGTVIWLYCATGGR